MAEVTTVTGMILSAMPVGEYDRRLVILTKEYGKITVFAKGARKPNSALIGVTRSFIFGTFEVYRGRESYTMYKASAKEYFENVVNDLNAVCYACYFAEIADYYGMTIRSSFAMMHDSAFRSVVLPLPVPPHTAMFLRAFTAQTNKRLTLSSKDPLLSISSRDMTLSVNLRIVIVGPSSAIGGMTMFTR